MIKYDVLVIGSGPGGYVAAIRAAQLGKAVAVVERAELGGICLNWGCIPTKSLLKSAEVLLNIKNARSYGIDIAAQPTVDLTKIIDRSRRIASQMSKGIEFLFKKNQITVISGSATLLPDKKVQVTAADGTITSIDAQDIIIATGARARSLAQLPIDGDKIISYRDALQLSYLPASMLVVGSGAIGVELAYFYASMGTKVSLVESMPNIVPQYQPSVTEVLERGLKKLGIKIYTNAQAELISKDDTKCVCRITSNTTAIDVESSVVLSAAGVVPNTEGLGLEALDIKTENGRIVVDARYQTSVPGIWAIGDVITTPALAHVAQAEGLACAENIAGHQSKAVNYAAIPFCVYTQPELAAVGLSEATAIEKGIDVSVGQFPFSALGKATAMGVRDGFASLVFDKQSQRLLGAQIVGHGVTELIAELTLAINKQLTAHDILSSVHAHPSMSEAIAEAAAQSLGECIHL